MIRINLIAGCVFLSFASTRCMNIQALLNFKRSIQQPCFESSAPITVKTLCSLRDLLQAAPATTFNDYISKRESQFVTHLKHEGVNTFGIATIALLLIQESLKYNGALQNPYFNSVFFVSRQIAAVTAISHTLRTFVIPCNKDNDEKS